MTVPLLFPDRGLAARQMIGQRLIVTLDKGRKPHSARVYHVSYKTRAHGEVEGAHIETDCGHALDFIPFDWQLRAEQIGERRAYRVTERGLQLGELCGSCVRSIGAALLGRSRKRTFLAPKAKRPKTYPDTLEGRRQRREAERRDELFARALFNVPYSEVKRRGIVHEGRGRKARYRLGDYDGSEGPAA